MAQEISIVYDRSTRVLYAVAVAVAEYAVAGAVAE